MDREQIINNLDIIGKHLDKNEKWFQYPEKKMISFEKEIEAWDIRFMKSITDIEDWMKDFDKRMEG